jgi:hypothetical protein
MHGVSQRIADRANFESATGLETGHLIRLDRGRRSMNNAVTLAGPAEQDDQERQVAQPAGMAASRARGGDEIGMGAAWSRSARPRKILPVVAMMVLTAPPRDSGDLAGAPSSASSVTITTESPIRTSAWISSPVGPMNRSPVSSAPNAWL